MIGRLRRNVAPRSQVKPYGSLARDLLFCGLPGADGSRLTDCGPLGLHGAPSGAPTRAMGYKEFASVHVKASAQYYSLGTWDALNPRSSLTILVYFRQTQSSNSSLFSRDFSGQRAYTFDQNSGFVRFYVNGGGSVGTNQLTGATSISLTDPYVAVATFDDARDTAKLWLNGKIDASSTSFTGTIPSSTAQTRVGARQFTGFEDYADAEIYLACLWGRALTDQEVIRLSRNPWAIFDRAAYVPGFTATAAGFKAAWAIGANAVIQTGARTA